MAGPGHPGPVKWGDPFDDDGSESVTALEYLMIQAEAVRLRARGWTLQRIANKLGYERSTIGTMLKRIEEETATENSPSAVRSWEINRLDLILDRLWPRLVPDDPNDVPDLRVVNTYLAMSKRRAELVGADVRPAQTLVIDDPAAMKAAEIAQARTERLERMTDLLDKMAGAGLGSGRMIDAVSAEKVDDDARPGQ